VADIFEEVDEEVRRDKFSRYWAQYGKLIIAGLVLVIVGTAGYVGWKQYRLNQQIEYSAQFSAALAQIEAKKDAEAVSGLEILAKQAGGGYGILARFREATLKASTGDRDGAVAIYQAMANDGGVDSLYADLARLYAVMHQLDTGEPEALLKDLAPLLVETGAWRYSARELAALLALRMGDTEAARKEYTQLADDPKTPSGIRARAAEMLQALKS